MGSFPEDNFFARFVTLKNCWITVAKPDFLKHFSQLF